MTRTLFVCIWNEFDIVHVTDSILIWDCSVLVSNGSKNINFCSFFCSGKEWIILLPVTAGVDGRKVTAMEDLDRSFLILVMLRCCRGQNLALC